MQEKLNLIQLPKIDTAKFSFIGEFNRQVARFERDFNISLEFNENARWRPGSYERLKTQMISSLFKHWSTPKGANTIRKLTNYDSYQLKGFRRRLINIDDKLKQFRANKQTLNEDKAVKEGNESYKEYMDLLLKPVDGVKVEITPLPWFSTRRRPTHDEMFPWMAEWDRPSNPIIKGFDTLRNFGMTNATYENRLRVYGGSTDPKRWFINVVIPINDVEVEYKNRSDETVWTNPYGDLVVCFTIPIYDVINNYRKIKAGETADYKLNTDYYSNHVYKNPIIPTLEHPFVQKSDRYGSYGWGNACFGEFNKEVVLSLSTGNLSLLKTVLSFWATVYPLEGTNPLNTPETHHLGKPKEWTERIANFIATNPQRCMQTVQEGYLDAIDILEDYCSNCDLMDNCDISKKLSNTPTTIPAEILSIIRKEHIGNWAPGCISNETPYGRYQDAFTNVSTMIWNHLATGNDSVAELFAATGVLDCGAGFIDIAFFHGLINKIYNDMIAPEEEMDILGLSKSIYELTLGIERIYWTGKLNHYHPEVYDNCLDKSKALDIYQAEEKLPLSNIRQTVNTYSMAQHGVLETEFYVTYNQEGTNATF